MTYPHDPHDRLPRGDKNRRVSLGLDRDEMAASLGITQEQLRQYEFTQPDRGFSADLAMRVGETLEFLEATRKPRVFNGPVPDEDAG